MSSQASHQRIAAYKERFDARFRQFFRSLPNQLPIPKESTFIPLVLDALRDLSLRGGKRQRVAFLGETCHLFTERLPQNFWAAALSIELLQTHLLIHDDIIDRSTTRRGGDTTWKMLAAALDQWGLNPEPAESLAILAGDLAAYLALAVLDGSSKNNRVAQALIRIQIDAGNATFLGQIYDLERDRRSNLTTDQLYVLADLKAVRSSTLAPMEMGLILVDMDDALAKATIRRYATWVGIAGQLQDDLLGIFGDPALTGKSNTSDLEEGKRTLLVLETLRRAQHRERIFLEKNLGRANLKPADFERIRTLMVATGAKTRVETVAHQCAERASHEAHRWLKQEWRPSAVAFFEDVARWFVNRQI